MLYVTIPSVEMLEIIASMPMTHTYTSYGTGTFSCPACGQGAGLKWCEEEDIIYEAEIKHDKNCPISWAKTALAAFKKV